MLPPAKLRPHRPPLRAVLVALAGLLPGLGAIPAAAVDGRADVSATRQSGGAGLTAYRTETLLENYNLGQRIDLSRSLLLNVDLLSRREQLEGRVLDFRTYTRTTSLVPSFALNYRQDHWHGSLTGRALRRDWMGTGLTARRDENAEFGTWLRAHTDSWEADLNLQRRASWREEDGNDLETRESNQDFSLRHWFAGNDDLRYTFGRSRQELRTYGSSVTYRSHQLQYRGAHRFAGNRGSYDIDAVISHFRQDGERQVAGGERLLQPLWGGFSLDDTPGFLDPLEADPVEDSRLYDGDRDAPSGVNIGDSAPPVQQYGGDWRNLIFDFGEPETLVSAALYVDTRVGFPGLIGWLVYVSDDPEGRDWGDPLDPGAYAMVYRDLADGRQGWLLTFTEPLVHRRLKLVDVKSGLTEPDIRVTEWEVYGPADTTAESVARTARGRLRGEVRYALRPALEVRYAADLDQRRLLDDDEQVTNQSHLLGAAWRTGGWRLQGEHQIYRLDSPTGRNTDANSQHLSLSSLARRDLSWRFAYLRNEDNSYTARHLTHTGSANVDWLIFPRLTLSQTVSYGVRDAEDIDGRAHSWAFITTLRGDIRPSMVATLRRADRWSDQEAGSGFTRFNDTDWRLNWALLPLLTLTSDISYRVRDDEQWILRHALTWSPLPGGSVQPRLYASDYQDTRSDYLRRGAGVGATWRARPRLMLEAGAEQTLIKERDQRNTPVNLNARGTWTF